MSGDPRVDVVAFAIWPWYMPAYVHNPYADVSTWHYLDRAAAGVAALDAYDEERGVDLDAYVAHRRDTTAIERERDESRAELVRLRLLAVDGHIEDDDRSGYCLCGAEWICPVWIEEVSLSDRAAESSRILGQLIDTQGQRDDLQSVVNAVRGLHSEDEYGNCCACLDEVPADEPHDDFAGTVPWPCPTIRVIASALDENPMTSMEKPSWT